RVPSSALGPWSISRSRSPSPATSRSTPTHLPPSTTSSPRDSSPPTSTTPAAGCRAAAVSTEPRLPTPGRNGRHGARSHPTFVVGSGGEVEVEGAVELLGGAFDVGLGDDARDPDG